jgi:hypothetical protein
MEIAHFGLAISLLGFILKEKIEIENTRNSSQATDTAGDIRESHAN